MYNEKGGHKSLKIIYGFFIATIFITMIFFPVISSNPPNEFQPVPELLPPQDTIKLNSTQEIENIILRIDEPLLARYIQKFQDYKTRYAYRGDKCNLVSEYIAQVFESNGLNTSYDPFLYKGWKMRNVIGEKQGTSSSDGTVILCAHYDSISTNAWNEAPGADDNGSGIAAVLAAAELLSDYEFNYTIRFIAFSGEELGLWGSYYYANAALSRGDNITAVINLDMIAFNPDPSTNEVYLVRDYGEDYQITNELVYGPAPVDDTIEYFWLGNTGVNDCTLYLEPKGSPGTYVKLTEISDYELNYTTGFIDLSGGYGPLAEFENLTAWYNYSVSGQLVDYMKETMQKYQYISGIVPVDLQNGQSDHARFSPFYPAIMLIERTFAANPHYHRIHDMSEFLNFTYCANITQIAVAAIAGLAELNSSDVVKPAHTSGFPPNGGFGQARPVISIEVTDASLLNISSFEMYVNGNIVSEFLTPIPLGYNLSYVPAIPFADGQVINISISANDTHDYGFNYSWEFLVDAIVPEPPTNFTIQQTQIELKKQGPVLDIGPDDFDKFVVQKPTVIFKDGEYKMWYVGHNGVFYQICYANSSDGISWTKHGEVLIPGIPGEADSVRVAYPHVIYDGEYKMWYSGYDNVNWRIMYANSSDGVLWVKNGVMIDIGPPGALDDTAAYYPTVLKTDEYEMWYTGIDGLYHWILYANSSDGITWTKYEKEITPSGIGRIHGDGKILEPTVIYEYGVYHMYYGRYDGIYLRTMYAKSTDGLHWTELGLAIDVGSSTDYDKSQSAMCSAMIIDNETKVWYSAFNGASWKIAYANLTQNTKKNDIALSWTESISDDVVRYEVFRESRPSAFSNVLESVNPEFYSVPDYLTPWTAQIETVFNLTAYGPVTGSHPPFFLLPDDNIIDISLYMKYNTGEWQKLVRGSEFTVDMDYGLVHLDLIYPFIPGSTFHAFYNHTATKAMKIVGNGMADIRAGASNQSYYYRIRAVDKVGNIAECTVQPGNIATQMISGWNLVSSPLLEGPTSLTEALQSIDWTSARTWDPENIPEYWRKNRTQVPISFNTLEFVDQTDGIWIESSPGNFSTIGLKNNITISMKVGWNLVSYPYHEIMSVSQALAGLPWEIVESFDSLSPYKINPLGQNDILRPGQGIWVYLTSDADWVAINL